MSVDLTRLVWKLPLPSGRKFVLLALADSADKATGTCWPSRDKLAEMTGLAPSRVSAHLRDLIEDGLIEQVRRHQKSAIYTVVRDRLQGPQDLSNRDVSKQDVSFQDECDSTPETSQNETSTPIYQTTKNHHSSETADEAENPDARKLCEHLADLMVDNGSKRPTITAKWINSARLLLTRDNRPLSEAISVLEWSQADSFWQDNIHSIQKFRTRYDTLRGRAAKDGALVPKAPQIDDREHARSWLLTQWETGSVAEVAKLTGIRWTAPDLPLGVSGSKAAEEFWRADRKRWIQENHELIISTLMRKQEAAA